MIVPYGLVDLGLIEQKPPVNDITTGVIINDKPVVVRPFTIAIIEYVFSAESGKDLDTRTFVFEPERSNVLGWNYDNSFYDFLTWAGDNTAHGYETVWIDIIKAREYYERLGHSKIKLRLNAFWYNQKGTGDIFLYLKTYEGGMVEKQGFRYINPTGKLVQDLQIAYNVSSIERNLGQEIAILELDLISKRGVLNKVLE